MLHPKAILTIISLSFLSPAFSQQGELTLSFTPANKSEVKLRFAKPLYKYDDPHGYWFINPHTGDRHFNLQPDAGYGDADAAFISFDGQQNDVDLFYAHNRDSSEVNFSNKIYSLELPDPARDGSVQPLHIHINSFTASEISFTVSGSMTCITRIGNTGNPQNVAVTGTGHFYREPKYTSSDVLPGCNCDPVIYGRAYDRENDLRTTSACETAFRNKVFDAMQKAFAPLFRDIAFSGKGKMSAGQIMVNNLPGHIDISGAPKERPYCSTDYRHNWIAGFETYKHIFNSDDGYGLRMTKMPSDDEFGLSQIPDIKASAKIMDSLSKAFMAKKISEAEYSRRLNELLNPPAAQKAAADFKQMDMEHNLVIEVIINPEGPEGALMKVSDKSRTAVQHKVAGAAFEIFSPARKDSDGEWLTNKEFVYFGKFTAPVSGYSFAKFDALLSKAVYPANANKLSAYNIIIKLQGGKDLIDKAMASIDFGAVQQLIIKQ